MNIIQPEGHVAHGEGHIISIGIPGVALHNLLFRDIHHVGTLLAHGFDRLIIIGLIVIRGFAVTSQIIFKIGNMLVFLIKIRRVAVHQIAGPAICVPERGLGNFRYPTDMVHVGMGADNKVQMGDTKLVDHILRNILAVAHRDLVRILFRLRDRNHPSIGILNRIGIAMPGIQQTPLTIGFD